MNRRIKIIISVVVAAVVVIAGLVIGLNYLNHQGSSSPKPFDGPSFDQKTLTSGNESLRVFGGDQYYLTQGPISDYANSTLITTSVSPPGTNYIYLYGDTVNYTSNNGIYTILEGLTYKGANLNVTAKFSSRSLSLGYVMVNNGTSVQTFSLNIQINIPKVRNVTLYSYDPTYPRNLTIVPHTYNLTESYQLQGQQFYEADFANYTTTSVDWYGMSGLYSGGTLTFSSQNYPNGTTLSLTFSGIRLPPGDMLDLGGMSLGY